MFLSCCCSQGKSVTCPVCQQSYPEHKLKHHIKTSHPGKEHRNIFTHIDTAHYHGIDIDVFQDIVSNLENTSILTAPVYHLTEINSQSHSQVQEDFKGCDLTLCVVFTCMFRTDTLPVQGKGLMVQRAEKCPYCDSYFLKNSSDFQQHIWAHEGEIFLYL